MATYRKRNFFLFALAAASSVDPSNAMAFRSASVSGGTARATMPTATSSPNGVVRTALFARSEKQRSGPIQALEETTATARDDSVAAHVHLPKTKIDTSSFGGDDRVDSYRNEMLDLVYQRSLDRFGLGV